MKNVMQWMPAIFFLSFLPLGMIFPYLVVELQQKNIVEMGLLLSLPSMMIMVTAPIWGMIADWIGNWTFVLRTATLMGLIGLTMLWGLDSHWSMWGMLLYSIGWAPIGPIIDALALEELEHPSVAHRSYGGLRLWGSIGYMAGVLSVGITQLFLPVSALFFGLCSSGVFLLVAFLLPAPKRLPQTPGRKALKMLFGNFELLWILICAGLHFSVHLANSNFLLKHLQYRHLDDIWASISISIGVIVEVVVLLYGKRLLNHYSPIWLFRVAVLLAIPRWIVMATSTDPWFLTAAQASHGITFGLFWIAAVQLVKIQTPPTLAATGQSLLGAAVGGVGATVGIYCASLIVQHYNTEMFYWAAVGVALFASLLTLRLRCPESNHP